MRSTRVRRRLVGQRVDVDRGNDLVHSRLHGREQHGLERPEVMLDRSRRDSRTPRDLAHRRRREPHLGDAITRRVEHPRPGRLALAIRAAAPGPHVVAAPDRSSSSVVPHRSDQAGMFTGRRPAACHTTLLTTHRCDTTIAACQRTPTTIPDRSQGSRPSSRAEAVGSAAHPLPGWPATGRR